MSKYTLSTSSSEELINDLIGEIYSLRGTTKAGAEIKNGLESVLKKHGVVMTEKCTGEAHSNGFIDNCGVCMPNWGWVRSKPLIIVK